MMWFPNYASDGDCSGAPSPSRNRATLQQSQRDPEAERQKKRDEVWRICAGLAGEPRILDRMVIELERALGSLANSARRG